MKILIFRLFSFFLFISITKGFSQQELSTEDFKPYTTYFTLGRDYEIKGDAKEVFEKALEDVQFAGLAELHRSRQLSYFTIGFLEILKSNGFSNFAMEMGPYSAEILENLSKVPEETGSWIRKLNKTYGKKLFRMTPLIFADTREDAMFIKKAAELKFDFWGLDQEFIYSYEMHIDSIFAMAQNKTERLKNLYEGSKKLTRKWSRKAARSKFKYNCQIKGEPVINQFFNEFNGNKKAEEYIIALKTSWDIYCKNEQGKGSNQQRADYMKSNFEKAYRIALKNNSRPKVFLKMGNIHLTKGKSLFGVNDMGKYLNKKAAENKTGFLSIRHLKRYQNGRDLIGKKGWEKSTLLMKPGKKDRWTIIDLRPLRKKLNNGELKADKRTTFELNSYDFLLISPDDKRSKPYF